MNDKPKYTAKLWAKDGRDYKIVNVWKVFQGGESSVSEEIDGVRFRVKSARLSSFTPFEETPLGSPR